MLHLPRVMFAAPSSGSGKTMITCGILEALTQRGRNPAAFKCGPDYIDPMFHTKVIGTPSRNLDTFFTEREVTRCLFARAARTAGVSVLEGVMGLYDGLGGISEKASSYDLACVTDTPIVLIVNARGMSLSVIPLIQGYLDYQKRFGREVIRGVILNQTTKMTCLLLKEEIEKQTGVRTYGYVPRLDDAAVESRHLGLVTPGEIADLRGRLARLGDALEQSLDLDGILSLAEEAEDYEDSEAELPPQIREIVGDHYGSRVTELTESAGAGAKGQTESAGAGAKGQTESAGAGAKEQTGLSGAVADDRIGDPGSKKNTWNQLSETEKAVSKERFRSEALSRPDALRPVRIAVARDEAFCFYYQDNLELLELLGAELVSFSPLHDQALPGDVSGLLLGGGYPELYARELSGNTAMKDAIRAAIEGGMPYLAECGGFMYLHETMEDMEGNAWPMCGCIGGSAYRTEKLRRFGYITLTPCQEEDSPGGSIQEREKSPSDFVREREILPGDSMQEREKLSGDLMQEQGKIQDDFMQWKGTPRNRLVHDQRKSQGTPALGFLRPGETIRAHEFHYFDSTDPGRGYAAKKPTGKRTWECAHVTDHSAAGFPHLYYWSNPDFAARFVESCLAFPRSISLKTKECVKKGGAGNAADR